MDIKTSIVVAVSENGVIGIDNQMPWHIPEDFKHFRNVTGGKPVIMGRKTFESILASLGKPLPKRPNVVISRTQNTIEGHPDVKVVSSLEEAIKLGKEIAEHTGVDEICIIGGSQIYHQAIDIVDVLHLTKVHESYDGDAFFPSVEENKWRVVSEKVCDTSTPACSFITLER